jgi:hypothetical protein
MNTAALGAAFTDLLGGAASLASLTRLNEHRAAVSTIRPRPSERSASVAGWR